LLCSLQKNGHMGGIWRHCLERDMEDRFSPVPSPEGAELPDDIELPKCPSRIFTTPYPSLRLRQVCGQVNLIPGTIFAVWKTYRELAMRDFELNRNRIPRFEDRREHTTLIRPYKAFATIDYGLGCERRRQTECLDVPLLP